MFNDDEYTSRTGSMPRRQGPRVISINISKGGIPKYPRDCIEVTTAGLAGDGHNHEKHYRLSQAVCLQDLEQLDALRAEGYPLFPGTTGENLTVGNLNINALASGTVLEFPSGLSLEITKARIPCYVLDAIDPQLKKSMLGRCGMYASVLCEGSVRVGDRIGVRLPQAQSATLG